MARRYPLPGAQRPMVRAPGTLHSYSNCYTETNMPPLRNLQEVENLRPELCHVVRFSATLTL